MHYIGIICQSCHKDSCFYRYLIEKGKSLQHYTNVMLGTNITHSLTLQHNNHNFEH